MTTSMSAASGRKYSELAEVELPVRVGVEDEVVRRRVRSPCGWQRLAQVPRVTQQPHARMVLVHEVGPDLCCAVATAVVHQEHLVLLSHRGQDLEGPVHHGADVLPLVVGRERDRQAGGRSMRHIRIADSPECASIVAGRD